jgi:hypothetical protein
VDFFGKDLAYAQIGVELLVLVLLVAFLWRTRGGQEPREDLAPEAQREPAESPALIPEELKATVERFISESEKISKAFEANLKDKKELSAGLILKLDRRLADYKELLAQTEAAVVKAEARLAQLAAGAKAPALEREGPNPAAPETRALVLNLAKKGLSVEEIAVQSKLLRGEVELIINLEKEFSV